MNINCVALPRELVPPEGLAFRGTDLGNLHRKTVEVAKTLHKAETALHDPGGGQGGKEKAYRRPPQA